MSKPIKFKTMFDINLTTVKAENLLKLYAEYVEGEIESSKDKYNELIKTANDIDILYIVYKTPFARHSTNLYINYLKPNNVKIPDIVLDKLISDANWLKEYEKKYMDR